MQDGSIASPRPVSRPVLARSSLGPLVLLLAMAVFVLLVLISGSSGFQGEDDLRYLHGAEAWLAGPHLPRTHFETRVPYLLSIRSTGLSEAGIKALHIGLCVLLMAISWLLSRPIIGIRPALFFVLVLACSPFLLQAAGMLQLEAFELPLCAAAFWLVQHRARGASRGTLIAAGAVLGVALVTRETAGGMALGLGLLLLRRRRLADAVLLAAVSAVPILVEMGIYRHATGDFLFRYHLDMRHVLGANPQLRGMVYKDGLPIFSPTLESRWITPSVLHVHWTVDAFLRLLTHPATLSTWLPAVLVLAGGRRFTEGITRALLADILIVMASVYVVTVFVLSLAPAPRYFDLATYLAALVLACGLSRLSRRHLAASVACLSVLLLSARMLADLTPSARPEVPFLMASLQAHDEPVFTSGLMADAAYIRLRDAGWLGRVHVAPPPVGALYVAETQTNNQTLDAACPDRRPRFQLLATGDVQLPAAWELARMVDLQAHVPHALAGYVGQRMLQPRLFRHQC